MFGEFTITQQDQREVLTYRLALSAVALGELALLVQWYRWGPSLAWPWLLLMAAGLGLALLRIHIYLRPLHLALKAFWLVGCLGGLLLAVRVGPNQMLPVLARQPLWILAVGPFFAALAGVGFKEFFCFQRPEAIGVTLLLPLALSATYSPLATALLSGWQQSQLTAAPSFGHAAVVVLLCRGDASAACTEAAAQRLRQGQAVAPMCPVTPVPLPSALCSSVVPPPASPATPPPAPPGRTPPSPPPTSSGAPSTGN
jgi:uncharacterized integral membrane protein